MLVGIVSINLGGVVGDWLIPRTSRLLVRNVCVAVASLGPMVCLGAICMLDNPSTPLILGLILLVHIFGGINAAGSYCVVLDIFPASASAFTGVGESIYLYSDAYISAWHLSVRSDLTRYSPLACPPPDNTIAQSTGIFAPVVTGILLDLGHCPSGSAGAINDDRCAQPIRYLMQI